MKKNAIFFVIMIGITIFGFSQSLQLTDNKGVVIPNNSEIIQATGPDGTEIITYMYVKNIGTKDISVLCRKSQFKMLDSTEITMCWAGACYPASTFLSPNAQLITVGQTIGVAGESLYIGVRVNGQYTDPRQCAGLGSMGKPRAVLVAG
jgi:hypothetical protein